MFFNFSNKDDIFKQIIDIKEWAPLNDFIFTILKKDFFITINKLITIIK